MISAIQRSGKRRQRRRPSPWLLVEVEASQLGPSVAGRPLTGQLVDTSAGGLGLILNHSVPDGSLVRVTRGTEDDPSVTATGDSASAPKPHAWERSEARVAYSTPLQDGGFRVGLAFKPEPPSTLELWATRALLSVSLLIVATAGLRSDGAASVIAWSMTALLLLLATGAEWQHRRQHEAYRRAIVRWDTVLPPSTLTSAAA